MMTDAQKKTTKNIVKTLERQRFANWYQDGDFASFIEGRYPSDDPRQPNREQILEQTVQMFNIGATGTCGG